MTGLGGIERLAGAPAPARIGQASSGAGFAVEAGSTPPPATAPALSGPAALSGLLALQEAEPAPVRDRDARRRGRAILAALTEMQRALLGAGDSDGTTARLMALLADMPVAEDPALNAILAAIRLRARVELARRQRGD